MKVPFELYFSSEIPEIYFDCHEKFGVNWNKGIIFAYDNTIYCKFKVVQPKITHLQQQRKFGGARIWWDKYLIDDVFRLDQEVEAYKNELEWIKRYIRSFDEYKKAKVVMAKILSSKMYGNITTYEEALEPL